MDLETENRIAAILMKEAAELRCQAEKEGVHAYLREPNVRFRPNSRFLTATVLGVQQANRVAEVNEMWRVRKKEREVNDELPRPSRDKKYSDSPRSTSSAHREHNGSVSSTGARYREQNNDIPSSSKAYLDDSCTSRDGGWKDEEIEQFLHSRVKRGRGGVGARMDEPGPYLPRSDPDSRTLESSDIREKEEWERRVLGPEKPRSLRSDRSSEDDDDQDNWKKSKRVKLESPKKHSKKHKRREDKHARKEKKDRKSKHNHKRRH